MKKALIFAAVTLAVSAAFGESVTATVTSTGAAAYSSPIPASGWLDRIEIVKANDTGTCDIVVGTYSGTTALEKFVNISALAEGTDTVVLRPRAVGTVLTSGTALTAAYSIVDEQLTNTVASTVLVAPYERMMIGGNLKLYASSTTNAVITATIYYERTPR